MAQEVVFLWLLVVEDDDELVPGGAGFLVRERYRAVPIGVDLPLIRRSDRSQAGMARVVASHVASPGVLLTLYPGLLDETTEARLRNLDTPYATLVRFEVLP